MGNFILKYSYFFLVLTLFVGTGILSKLGYVMGSNASSSLTKIHPSTYLVFGFTIFNLPIIVRYIFQIPKILIFGFLLIIIIFLFLYFLNYLDSVSFILDTLLTPLLVSLLVLFLSPSQKIKINNYCLYFIIINSLLAIIERIISINFFEISTGYGDIFRSTALLGHPLNNALITSIFILYVLVTEISLKRKIFLLLILYCSLICFGARGALYTSVLALVVLFLLPSFFSNNVYYKSLNKGLLLGSILFMSISLVYLVLFTKLGERLLDVSFFDSSASVRVSSIDLISIDNVFNYLLPISNDKVASLSYYNGVDIIENFVIIWIFKFGLILTVILILYYYSFLSRVIIGKVFFIKNLMLLLFLLLASTNNSLATNTQALSIFVFVFSTSIHKYNSKP